MYWHGEYTNNGKKKLLPYRISDTDEVQEIPCGRCMACRVNYGRLWSVRCVCEAKEHKENYFLTFTIDDQHVKDTLGNVGIENLVYVPTTDLDDITKFMKALRQDQMRNYQIQGIRYLACSEMGSQTFRPHYHMILFGAHLNDLKPYTKSSGYWIYTSEYLKGLWKQGEVYVGEVSADSAGYVAKYATKNTDSYKELCDTLKVRRPGLRMSRRPGIGKHYFDKHRDQIMKDRGVYIEGKLVPIPEYWIDDVQDYESDLLKNEREVSRLSKINQSNHYGIQDQEENRMLGIRPLTDEMHERSYL